MKKITFFILMIIANVTLANSELVFKSAGLNKITETVKNYSPELVSLGEVESGSCGTYHARFVMKKMSASELAAEYILNVTSGYESINLDFTALELSEEQESKLSKELADITEFSFQRELQYTNANVYSKDSLGVIFSYSSVYTSVITDTQTKEFLLLSGDTQQDDCD